MSKKPSLLHATWTAWTWTCIVLGTAALVIAALAGVGYLVSSLFAGASAGTILLAKLAPMPVLVFVTLVAGIYDYRKDLASNETRRSKDDY